MLRRPIDDMSVVPWCRVTSSWERIPLLLWRLWSARLESLGPICCTKKLSCYQRGKRRIVAHMEFHEWPAKIHLPDQDISYLYKKTIPMKSGFQSMKFFRQYGLLYSPTLTLGNSAFLYCTLYYILKKSFAVKDIIKTMAPSEEKILIVNDVL